MVYLKNLSTVVSRISNPQ